MNGHICTAKLRTTQVAAPSVYWPLHSDWIIAALFKFCWSVDQRSEENEFGFTRITNCLSFTVACDL
jgi:hypothetical protein